MFKVSWAAILQGWFDKSANLWQIPLIPVVLNSITDTVLVNKPPTSTNSKHNQNWYGISTHVRVSPPNHHGSKQ